MLLCLQVLVQICNCCTKCFLLLFFVHFSVVTVSHFYSKGVN